MIFNLIEMISAGMESRLPAARKDEPDYSDQLGAKSRLANHARTNRSPRGLGHCVLLLLGIAAVCPPVAQASPGEKEFIALVKTANDLYRDGDFSGAALRYSKALEIREDPQVRFNLGNSLYRTGDMKGAVQAFGKAIELKPDFAEAACNLGMVLFELKDYKGTLEALKAAGVGAAILRIRAACFERMGDLGSALFALEQGSQIAPGDVDIRTARGAVLYRMRRFSEAAEAFRFVLASKPADADAWKHLGYSLAGSLNASDAAEALEMALRLSAGPNPGVAALLGDLYVEMGLFRQAAKMYASAAGDGGRSPGFLLREANLFIKSGETAAAAASLRAALEKDPGLANARVVLGDLALDERSFAEAEGHFADAAASKDASVSSRALRGLGDCRAAAGDLKQAMEYYGKSCATDPAYSKPYSGQGRVHFLNGDYAKAASLFRTALELDSADSAAAGMLDEAMRALNRGK